MNLKTKPKKEELKIKLDDSTPRQITTKNGAALTATIATIAIFVRFFVVVDIVINFFGKINVKLGPRIAKIVDFLKNL